MSSGIDIKVECYAGHRAEERPTRFFIGDRRVEVTEIIDRWLGEDHRYFKVRGDDGDIYILRHDEQTDQWQLGGFRRDG